MKTPFVLLIISLTLAKVHGQYFMPEIDNTDAARAIEVYAVTIDGDTIRGKVTFAVMAEGFRKITIKDELGVKYKMKAEHIQLLAVKPQMMVKVASYFSAPSVKRMLKADFEDVVNREWVFFELVLLPQKRNKFSLLQLLNSGFDSKIKVYLDPSAKETSGLKIWDIKLTGGMDKSYIVVIGGLKSIYIKKKKYNKEAQRILYNNCPIFKEHYAGDKFKIKDMAKHVFVYDQLCDN